MRNSILINYSYETILKKILLDDHCFLLQLSLIKFSFL